MTLQQLPERANLEQLKKQAKSLLAAARSQEPNARPSRHDGVLPLRCCPLRLDRSRGHVEAVKFAATPLVWACEGWRHTSQNDADHVEVARLLLAAGSPREWVAPEKAPDPEGTQDRLAELCRAAEAA